MTNDELIAAARARLAEHGANSAVMKELAAVLAAYDYERDQRAALKLENFGLPPTLLRRMYRRP